MRRSFVRNERMEGSELQPIGGRFRRNCGLRLHTPYLTCNVDSQTCSVPSVLALQNNRIFRSETHDAVNNISSPPAAEPGSHGLRAIPIL